MRWFIVLLGLAGLAAADRVNIGFRSVSTDTCLDYRRDDAIIWDSNKAGTGRSSDQLGEGVYLTMVVAAYLGGEVTGCHCKISVDGDKWNQVQKFWVPNNDGCTDLWFGDAVGARADYLKRQTGWLVADTVMLAKIWGQEDVNQFLLPPSLLTASNPLDMQIQCANKGFPFAYQVWNRVAPVNWLGWQNLRNVPPGTAL